jgi:hypothetical protein
VTVSAVVRATANAAGAPLEVLVADHAGVDKVAAIKEAVETRVAATAARVQDAATIVLRDAPQGAEAARDHAANITVMTTMPADVTPLHPE